MCGRLRRREAEARAPEASRGLCGERHRVSRMPSSPVSVSQSRWGVHHACSAHALSSCLPDVASSDPGPPSTSSSLPIPPRPHTWMCGDPATLASVTSSTGAGGAVIHSLSGALFLIFDFYNH